MNTNRLGTGKIIIHLVTDEKVELEMNRKKITSIKIDGKGVKRVTRAIQSAIHSEPILPLEKNLKEQKRNKKKDYQLSHIDDSTVNRYLNARNLKINLENMIDKSPIKLLAVNMRHCSMRPLVGNGINRDTHIVSNVQQADEDLRKDMILTEAGLEVTVPERHALYSFESL